MCEETAIIVVLAVAATVITLVAFIIFMDRACSTNWEQIDKLTKPAKDRWEEEKRSIMTQLGAEN